MPDPRGSGRSVGTLTAVGHHAPGRAESRPARTSGSTPSGMAGPTCTTEHGPRQPATSVSLTDRWPGPASRRPSGGTSSTRLTTRATVSRSRSRRDEPARPRPRRHRDPSRRGAAASIRGVAVGDPGRRRGVPARVRPSEDRVLAGTGTRGDVPARGPGGGPTPLVGLRPSRGTLGVRGALDRGRGHPVL